jgi:hypothetical protein
MVVLRSISLVMTPPSVSMPERQRRNIKQQYILDVTLQHAGLDCGADRDHFVRIDALVRIAPEQLLHGFLDFRHAGLPADQHDLINI